MVSRNDSEKEHNWILLDDGKFWKTENCDIPNTWWKLIMFPQRFGTDVLIVRLYK